MQRSITALMFIAAGMAPALAQPVGVDIKSVTTEGVGASIGTIELTDSPKGLLLSVSLSGLAVGTHGFHVHEKGDCAPGQVNGAVAAAGAAGPHLDPDATGKHAGPTGEGHRGDLPVLDVAATDGGKPFTIELLAPRLTLADIKGRALMIHANGDNYADAPAPLGGGGARIACGVIAP